MEYVLSDKEGKIKIPELETTLEFSKTKFAFHLKCGRVIKLYKKDYCQGDMRKIMDKKNLEIGTNPDQYHLIQTAAQTESIYDWKHARIIEYKDIKPWEYPVV